MGNEAVTGSGGCCGERIAPPLSVQARAVATDALSLPDRQTAGNEAPLAGNPWIDAAAIGSLTAAVAAANRVDWPRRGRHRSATGALQSSLQFCNYR